MDKFKEQYHKKNWSQRIISIFLIALIIIMGVYFSKYLMKTKKKTLRKKVKKTFVNVEIFEPLKVNVKYKINGFGRIFPAKKVTLIPEVSGKIIYVNKKFVEGGYFKKGEIILKIDDSDYKINLRIQEAKLNSLLEDLKIEKAKAKSAKEELNKSVNLLDNITDEDKYIIERKPFVKKIEEEIKATKERVDKAKLDLNRTIIKAPFNCYITKKYVDLGSYVSPGVKLADVVLSDYYYIKGNIMLSDLKYLDSKNADAIVYFSNNIIMKAKLKFIEKELDKKGLMLKVILYLKPKNKVFLYDYVTFDIIGKTLRNIYKFPRKALRDDSSIWVVKDNYLKIKKIKVIFKDINNVYTYDVSDKDKIIITNLSSVIDGLYVKVIKRLKYEN